MRKLFFTLCFISLFICSSFAGAAVRSLSGPMEMPPGQARPSNVQRPQEHFDNQEELVDYLKERIQNAVITEIPPEEARSSISTDIQPSDEYIEMMKKEEKSFFQQVYENAIARVGAQPQTRHQDIVDKRSTVTNTVSQQRQWAQPNYPTVKATLPGGTVVLVPAIEHIPYMMSDIEILSTGIIKIDEKVVIIANGEKLKNGLSKSLPRYSFSRSGEKKNLNVNLISVKVNGKEIEYKIEEFGNNLLFTPKEEYILEPGIYTYDFEYIVDRQIVEYDSFKELYWNITGNNWNLIVARVGAILRMPGNKSDLGRTSFINGRNAIDMNATRFVRPEGNVLGFISTRPVFVGESMDIIVSLDNDNFIPVDINKRINWFIDDYGDTILSLLGLLAIAGAYYVSWVFITDNKSGSKYSIQRNGPIIRYLLKGGFDKISFGSFLLELYKRKIVDLKSDVIIKLTDNLTSLTKNEKLAVNSLFPNHESSIKTDQTNKLKFNRAYNLIEADTKQRLRKFLLKINAGYIMFSIAMLLLSQLGIAMLGYSPIYNMTIMVCSDIIIVIALIILLKKYNSKILTYLYKTFSILLILTTFAVLVSILNTFSAIVIIITIYAIFAYTNKFSNRNGLIKNTIKEAKATRDYLIKNIDTVIDPRGFASHQPNIFALELNDQYREKLKDKDFYKLDIVSNMITKI